MRLTDDEVVALAVRTGAPWGAPTPTVDPTDADAVAAAARRGERSLFARELLTEDPDQPLGALDARLAELLRPALDGALLYAVYVTDAELRWYFDALNAAYYGTSGSEACLAESVSPRGVHEFAGVARADVERSVRELADAAIAGGVRSAPGATADASLCIAISGDQGTRVLQLGRDTAVEHVPDGGTPRPLDADGVAAFLAPSTTA